MESPSAIRCPPAHGCAVILDTTLREGVQSRLWKLTDGQRMSLARDLVDAGVREVEVGCAGRDALSPRLIRTVQRRGARAFVWTPARADLVRSALQGNPDGICLSIPVSPHQVATKLRTDRQGLLEMLRASLRILEGKFVVLGLEDASRADPDLLEQVALLAGSQGVSRLRIADTLGLLDPAATGRLVSWLARVSSLPVAFHGHDDFGMANANALSALDAGACSVDASLGGFGERAGIAGLEQLAAWLVLRRGERGPDPGRLADLARRTARHCGQILSSTRAVTGGDLFRCGSGLHVHGLQIDNTLYEPFSPESVGVRRTLEFGAQTGRAAIRTLFVSRGIPADSLELDSLVEHVRDTARSRGRALSAREVMALGPRGPLPAPTPPAERTVPH